MLSRQQLLFLPDLEAQSDPGRALVVIPLEAKLKGDPPTKYVSSLKPLDTSSPLGRGDQPFDSRAARGARRVGHGGCRKSRRRSSVCCS